jgi:hypothetical protein
MPPSLQLLVKGHVSLQPLSKEGGLLAGSEFLREWSSKKSQAKDCGDEKTCYLCRPVEQTGSSLKAVHRGVAKFFNTGSCRKVELLPLGSDL